MAKKLLKLLVDPLFAAPKIDSGHIFAWLRQTVASSNHLIYYSLEYLQSHDKRITVMGAPIRIKFILLTFYTPGHRIFA